MTSAERTTLGSSLGAADEGMTVYNTTDDVYEYWSGSAWVVIGEAGGYDDDWTPVGGDIERQSGDVYIGDAASTNNDLYISDDIIDWDDSQYYLDPSSNLRVNEVEGNTGSATDPSFYFDGDANSGLYQPANDQVAISAGGSQIIRAQSTGISIGGNADNPNSYVDIVGGTSGAVSDLLTIRSDFTANNTGSTFRMINSTSATSEVGAELQALTSDASNGFSDLILKVHGSGGASGALEERMRIKGDGDVVIGSNGYRGKLTFYAEQGAVDYGVTFAPSSATTQNSSYTLPPDDGDADYVLRTDGAGVLTWADPSTLSDGDWTVSGVDQYSAVSGNVGIGTTTPFSKLEVYDAAGPTVTITKDGADASSLFFRNGTGGGATDGASIGLTTAEHLTFTNSITDKDMFFNVNVGGTPTDVLFVDGGTGRVGVNNTAPDYDLEVGGDAGIDNSLFHNGDPNTYLSFTSDRIQLFAGSGSSSWIDMQNSATEMAINENGVNRDLRVEGGSDANLIFADGSADRVGIGTNDPSSKLEVFDEAGGSEFMARLTKNSNTVGELAGIGFGSQLSFSYAKSAVMHERESANGTGKLHFLVDDVTDAADVTLAESRMTIDRNGLVGIGNQSPARNLDIYEDTDGLVAIRIENPNTGNSSVERLSFSDESGDLAGIATYDDGHVAYASQMRIFNNRTGGKIFITNGDGGVNLDATGNVGISTTSPTNELDVDGQIRMRTGATAGYIPVSDANGVMTWTAPTALNGDFIQNQSASDQTADFRISGDGTIRSGLTVGDGITLDDNNLNAGTVGAQSLAFGSGSGEAIGSKRTAGGNQFGLDFFTNSAARLSIENGGHVGINNTAPGNPLHVVGLSTADFDVARFDGSSTFGAAVRVSSTAAGGRDWTMISTANAAGEGAGKLLFKDETGGNVRMTIENGGDVGIGTTDPQSQFHVVTTQTGNVSKLHNTGLANGSLVGHEFGKANTTNNMAEFRYNHVSDGNATNYVNLGLWGNANTLVVQGSGRIGLGTTTPLITMDATQGAVYGSTATSGSQHDVANRNTKVSFGSAPSNNTSEFAGMRVVVGAGTNGCGNTSDIRFDTWECNTSASREVMRISGRGRVGIGTNNPSIGMLHVNGATNHDLGGFAYFAYSGCNVQGCAGGTKDVSIYATGRVIATEFNAHSDARIKNIHGVSNSSEDLASLMGIEVTDYTYKDELKGDHPFKKVIAQQVEEVYPQAVTNDVVETVPDIYSMAVAKGGYIELTNDLKKGDRVKLLFEDATETVEVLEATADGFTVATEKEGDVFVYGREVSDFRTVDYEAISMLNVSATQELYKMILQLQQENADVKAELGRIDALSSELEEIKASLGIGIQSAR